MKTKITILILSACVLIMSAKCNKENICEEPPGICHDSFIVPPKNEIIVPATGGIVTITTTDTGWWFDGMSLDGKGIAIEDEYDASSPTLTISTEYLVLERKSETELSVTVSANPTSTERLFGVGLQEGNCLDGIFITQSAGTSDTKTEQ